MPAQPANKNAMRHGLRAGSLPKGASYVQRACNTLRRELESAVMGRHGSIDVYRAALIQSACRWERHALLCQRWLRREVGDMTADQRLAYSRDIAKASESRDRALKALGLDADGRDVWDALYSDPSPAEAACEPPAGSHDGSSPHPDPKGG